ncbi:MAG: acyl-CoA desaturase [Thermosynechococcaceae cyanobacterium]
MPKQGANKIPGPVATRTIDSDQRLKFGKSNDFQVELRRRVDEFFQHTGRRQRDCPQMYAKTAILLSCFASLYWLLVFVVQTGWQAILLAMLLGLAMAAIGFNIQHDGSHQAYSDRAWINKLMAMTLDLIGGSSYNWHWKHIVFHHTYVNITGYDTDLDIDGFGRLTPHQPWFPSHRWQHLYLWPMYGLMPIRWHFYDDFHAVFTGRIGGHRYPRPKGWELVIFWAGKAIFLLLAFGIPLQVHSLWKVLGCYGVTVFVLGLVLSVVFQLAHAVEEANFLVPCPETGRIDKAWTVHQIETTVNFSRRNPVITWLLGGLNLQVEHHLFPKICHVNYPALSYVVEETCREFGVTYLQHRSLWAGITSHFRWLHRMGT